MHTDIAPSATQATLSFDAPGASAYHDPGTAPDERIAFFEERLTRASGAVSSAKWERGDVLVQARAYLGDRWTQLLDLDTLPVSDAVLRQELCLSARFPSKGPRARVDGVDWSLHRLVANDAIPDQEASALLERARDQRWSYRRMEEAVRDFQAGGDASLGSDLDFPDPTALQLRPYVQDVVALRCPEVPAPMRRAVLTAAWSAADEWQRSRSSGQHNR